MPEKKIDLFIIGAQKAGTTSLKNYLGEHPEMTTHAAKEFSYFYDDEEYRNGFDAAFAKYFPKFVDEGRKIVCKHAHLYTSEKGIARLKEHNPDCQLVFIIRNPVTRTFSSYLMEKLYSRVNFEFEDIRYALDGSNKLKLEDWQREAIIDFGLYSKHLKNIYRHFPKEQVHLILFEDFKKAPLLYCQRIFKLFEINDEFQPRVRIIHNKTAIPRSRLLSNFIKVFLVNKNPLKEGIKKVLPASTSVALGEGIRKANRSEKAKVNMNQETEAFLKDFFKPYNEELKAMTGMDLSVWK